MLYTVVPLERIYTDFRQYYDQSSVKQKDTDAIAPEYKLVNIQNGHIVTRRDGENYVIEKINSTDMSDYLNEAYSPGKTMR